MSVLTFAEALDLLAGRVDGGWLAELRSTPDGEALLGLAVDILIAADQEDAERAGQLWLVAHSAQETSPASGPTYATLTLAVTLRRTLKTTRPITLPAGTPVTTPDGHIFRTDSALTWGVGEVGTAKTVAATAVLPGRKHVPPGELTAFRETTDGLSGVGLAVNLLPSGGGQPKALRLQTDTAIPHAFRAELVGSYVELSTVLAPGEANEGRALRIVAINNTGGMSPPSWGDAPEPGDNQNAWGEQSDTTTDAWMSPWATGTFGFSWRAIPWGELFAVENTTAATGGSLGLLDELAEQVGRPRQPGEEDELLRARLAGRHSPPSPLGALRAAIRTLAPWGFGRLDLRIYELGAHAPDSTDPYAFNFPAALGFISDLHSTDMTTPETPDGMASQDPDYATLSPFFNPGLALLEPGTLRWAAVVRWDPPGTLSADVIATLRRLLFAAVSAAKPAGCLVQLYHLPAWSYP
jgi:hypothetical protein